LGKKTSPLRVRRRAKGAVIVSKKQKEKAICGIVKEWGVLDESDLQTPQGGIKKKKRG